MNGDELDALHQFADESLRRRALTHASAGRENNERLEWLGDALGDFLIGDLLFAEYPALGEGMLTLARSFLVGDKNLAAAARKIGMARHLILSPAEERGGGRDRDSILAGAAEAYMAAIYLDGGMDAARRAAKMLFADSLAEARTRIARGALKDGKTRLQEYLQKRKTPPPEYRLLEQGEIARRPYCVSECRTGEMFAVGVGGGRRESEQLAAAAVLAALQKE